MVVVHGGADLIKKRRRGIERLLNFGISPDLIAIFGAFFLGGLGYLISGRDIAYDRVAMAQGGDGTLNPLNQLANALFIAMAVYALFITVISKLQRKGLAMLGVTMVIYILVALLLPVYFDPEAEFQRSMLYPLVAIPFIFLPINISEENLAFNFAIASSLPAIMSLIMLVISPGGAILQDYDSIIPGFGGRLYGVTAHANALGATCIMPILLLATYRARWNFVDYTLISANLVALVLSQSKTSMFSLVVGLLFLWAARLGKLRWITRTSAVAIFIVYLLLEAAFIEFQVTYAATLEGLDKNGALTLTGRTYIWTASLDMLKDNVLFGPGWGSFLKQMQIFHPDIVANPHNVYITSLIQSGIFGLASLVAFYLCLLVYAVDNFRTGTYFPLVFFVIVCVRSTSESFLMQGAFVAPIFLATLIHIRMTAYRSMQSKRRRRQRLPDGEELKFAGLFGEASSGQRT